MTTARPSGDGIATRPEKWLIPLFSFLMSAMALGQESTGTSAPVLIPAAATMVTAWEIPRNPLQDSSLASHKNGEQIRRGFRLFMNTHDEAPHLSHNNLSCNNCHLNGGQKEKAMPVVGLSRVYPEHNKRAGKVFTITDRIAGCFLRSQNGSALLESCGSVDSAMSIIAATREVSDLAAYIDWLSDNCPAQLPWRGQNIIRQESIRPVEQLDLRTGEKLFGEKCANCHGEDGQGVPIGDKKAGPLWGPDSWNDGAGAARIYTLAGIIR
jgi:thiosulfate dehydrogenase